MLALFNPHFSQKIPIKKRLVRPYCGVIYGKLLFVFQLHFLCTSRNKISKVKIWQKTPLPPKETLCSSYEPFAMCFFFFGLFLFYAMDI